MQSTAVQMAEYDPDYGFSSIAASILLIVASVPAIYATIKRCRDCGISPYWTWLFMIVPLTGLYIYFPKSKFEGNKFI